MTAPRPGRCPTATAARPAARPAGPAREGTSRSGTDSRVRGRAGRPWCSSRWGSWPGSGTSPRPTCGRRCCPRRCGCSSRAGRSGPDLGEHRADAAGHRGRVRRVAGAGLGDGGRGGLLAVAAPGAHPAARRLADAADRRDRAVADHLVRVRVAAEGAGDRPGHVLPDHGRADRGVRATERQATSLLRSMGASRWQQFRYVRLPGALPSFFTALRIGITYAVTGAIFAEYVGATAGLGIFMRPAEELLPHRPRARRGAGHRAAVGRPVRADLPRRAARRPVGRDAGPPWA